ncbi:MAG: dihydrofolate reductase [Rikenellaceae bacterium]
MMIDTFDDIRILRFDVPNFQSLKLRDKIFIYYLSEAALSGRDILFDQNFRYNLPIRSLLESIYAYLKGKEEGEEWNAFVCYLKKVWFANGIHHHYSTDKFIPKFSKEYLLEIAKKAGVTVDNTLIEIIFDPQLFKKRVSEDSNNDLISSSANNFYYGVTQKEAEDFYSHCQGREMHGLNSRLTKIDGKVVEEKWHIGGKYSSQIEKIVFNLQKALPYSQNEGQKEVIDLLIQYYQSGDLKIFDQYSIKWLEERDADIDFINGFIEVYGDPLGLKGSWEAMVNIKDKEATKLSKIISDNALWFEEHSPIDPRYRKKEVKGVSSKVISAIMLGGDCYPATPIGINLPNADWIRKEHGSKSVSINNITAAYEKASLSSGMMEEFYYSNREIELSRIFGEKAGNLHTELHECLGHGSGQLADGVTGDELKNYGSTLEEIRADLFALYFMGDKKMIELGVMSSMDSMKAEYYSYIFNGIMGQLVRIEKGKDVVQAHMRCRKTISEWCFANGNVIAIVKRDNKRYIEVKDYDALRVLFGKLLWEVQRIKSEGDYKAGKDLIEKYGVTIKEDLHDEVLERYRKLNLAPYSGFVNPKMEVLYSNGEITDIVLDFTEEYDTQMLRYSQENRC